MPFVDVDKDGAPVISGGYANEPADRPSIWLEEDDPRWLAHVEAVSGMARPSLEARLQAMESVITQKQIATREELAAAVPQDEAAAPR